MTGNCLGISELVSVHPELVEGWPTNLAVVRQAHHERYGPIPSLVLEE